MYGFIYIWYDRYRRMFYIGCHWGTENDGYICSSRRMRDAHRYRPEDFKRRVIQRNIPRENLLTEEYKWLSLIPDKELGKRYYNLSKKHFGHWANDLNARLTVGQKVAKAKTGSKQSQETVAKRVAKITGKKCTDETKQKISVANRGKKRTDEVRKKIGDAGRGRDPWNKGMKGINSHMKEEWNRRYIENNGNHKLTLEQVIEIKRKLASGLSPTTIAPLYGVHRVTISDIKNGRRWSHLTTY